MPGNYAHYRFAAARLQSMDKKARNIAERFRALYDVGAQGPDPFFYFNPFVKNKAHQLSHQIHMTPGREFFEQAGRIYRTDPTEAGLAYLYGCLTHFCLDSVCHPYVNEVHDSGAGEHMALETEFNRFLLELDGKPSPHTADPSAYLTLTRGECDTAASFYRGISGRDFARCMGHMRLFGKLFAAPEGLPRNAVKKVTDMVGYGGFVMSEGPDGAHEKFNAPMLALYQQAADQYPGMLAQLQTHLEKGTPLGKEFDAIYG